MYLLSMLYEIRPSRVDLEGDDALWMGISTNRKFTVKSFYGDLVGRSGGYFPWKSIWLMGAPCKVSLFICMQPWEDPYHG